MSETDVAASVAIVAVVAVVVATVLLVEFFLQHRSKHKVKPFDIAADESSSVHSKKGVEVVVRVNEAQRATVALLRNGAGQHLLRWRSHDATALRVQRNGKACELRDGECSLYGYPVCELVPAEASKGKRVTRSLKEDELPVLEELMLALLRDDDAERYSLVHDDEDGRPQHRRPSWKGAGSKFLSPRGDKPAAAAAAAAAAAVSLNLLRLIIVLVLRYVL